MGQTVGSGTDVGVASTELIVLCRVPVMQICTLWLNDRTPQCLNSVGGDPVLACPEKVSGSPRRPGPYFENYWSRSLRLFP